MGPTYSRGPTVGKFPGGYYHQSRKPSMFRSFCSRRETATTSARDLHKAKSIDPVITTSNQYGFFSVGC